MNEYRFYFTEVRQDEVRLVAVDETHARATFDACKRKWGHTGIITDLRVVEHPV